MGRTILNMSEEELHNTEMRTFFKLIEVHKEFNNMGSNGKGKSKKDEAFIDNILF